MTWYSLGTHLVPAHPLQLYLITLNLHCFALKRVMNILTVVPCHSLKLQRNVKIQMCKWNLCQTL